MRKLSYYVAVTLDGRIAGPEGQYDFFPWFAEAQEELLRERPETIPVQMREQFGVSDTPNVHYDTVLMGRNTYEVPDGAVNPYPHLEQYVFTSSGKPSPAPEMVFTDRDPVEVVRELKQREGKGIWLCGGGKLAGALLPEIDELCLKLSPVAAGDGVPLFGGAFAPTAFTLVQTRTFSSGFVYLRYNRATDS